MYYSTFITRAILSTIKQMENETWYLEPEWKDIICREIESDLSKLRNSYLSDWRDVESILRLETERRNAQSDKKKEVINWLHETIFAAVEPAMLQEENEFIKNMMEYLNATHAKIPGTDTDTPAEESVPAEAAAEGETPAENV